MIVIVKFIVEYKILIVWWHKTSKKMRHKGMIVIISANRNELEENFQPKNKQENLFVCFFMLQIKINSKIIWKIAKMKIKQVCEGNWADYKVWHENNG